MILQCQCLNYFPVSVSNTDGDSADNFSNIVSGNDNNIFHVNKPPAYSLHLPAVPFRQRVKYWCMKIYGLML